jgi:hypothetical protein
MTHERSPGGHEQFLPSEIEAAWEDMKVQRSARERYEISLHADYPRLYDLLQTVSAQSVHTRAGVNGVFHAGAMLGFGHMLHVAEASVSALPAETDYDYTIEANLDSLRVFSDIQDGSADIGEVVRKFGPADIFTLAGELHRNYPTFYSCGVKLAGRILQRPALEVSRYIEDYHTAIVEMIEHAQRGATTNFMIDALQADQSLAFMDGYANVIIRMHSLLAADSLRKYED